MPRLPRIPLVGLLEARVVPSIRASFAFGLRASSSVAGGGSLTSKATVAGDKSGIAGDGPLTSNRKTNFPRAALPTLWLRDACTCPHCVDPHSGQKNFSTTELPNEPELESLSMREDGSMEIVWKNDTINTHPRAPGDKLNRHTSVYPPSVVKFLDQGFTLATATTVPMLRTPWNKAVYTNLLNRGHCRITYSNWLHNENAFWEVYRKLCETGLIFVTGVPGSETAVEAIANRIGDIMHTFYGSTWDVRSKPQAENVAYTSQFLGLHQDLLYHHTVPRLQLLHCLENSCEGGESLFSDGVRAAYEMELTSRETYRKLSEFPVHFHYTKGGRYYTASSPTIKKRSGYVDATRWAPPFQGPFLTHDGLDQWRTAAEAFQQNVEAPQNVVEMKLNPGECVIFDNTRLLHGRRAFATTQGQRWLKGTYIANQVHRARECELTRRIGRDNPKCSEGAFRFLGRRERERVAALVGMNTTQKVSEELPSSNM